MKKNVGGIDKYIRIFAGCILVFVGYREEALWATLLGAILFFTGWYGWCGLYSLLGKTTCKNSPQ
ncbi:MAG: DUF2892 domain-containing protein [Candidatus Pacebacteria bacterium]|nr:DUF2892 domain-containing protein [Candidatus Paceibacterota bacterium]MBP9780536.1 DUF2892 domain-containing protein [Candidatus Paceibacterota bacterium]